MGKTIYVNCAFCSGLMEIDVDTGKVVKKWEHQPDGEGDKMSSALRKLEDQKKKRATLFEEKTGEIREQKKRAEESFEQEVKKVKKEGVKQNPVRPFDLD